MCELGVGLDQKGCWYTSTTSNLVIIICECCCGVVSTVVRCTGRCAVKKVKDFFFSGS